MLPHIPIAGLGTTVGKNIVVRQTSSRCHSSISTGLKHPSATRWLDVHHWPSDSDRHPTDCGRVGLHRSYVLVRAPVGRRGVGADDGGRLWSLRSPSSRVKHTGPVSAVQRLLAQLRMNDSTCPLFQGEPGAEC